MCDPDGARQFRNEQTDSMKANHKQASVSDCSAQRGPAFVFTQSLASDLTTISVARARLFHPVGLKHKAKGARRGEVRAQGVCLLLPALAFSGANRQLDVLSRATWTSRKTLLKVSIV